MRELTRRRRAMESGFHGAFFLKQSGVLTFTLLIDFDLLLTLNSDCNKPPLLPLSSMLALCLTELVHCDFK